MKEELTALSDKEKELVQQIANVWGVPLEEAASRLLSEGMEARYRRRTGKGPANNVRRLRNRF